MTQTKQRLHVLHTESVYSRGGEKYLYELLKRVAATHEVRLYLHRISPQWRHRYRQSRIEVVLLWKPVRLFWPLLPLTLLINYMELKKIIKKTDVLFATNFPMNFLAIVISNKAICHCFEPLAIFYDPIRIASLSRFSQFCVAVAKMLYARMDMWAYTKSAVLTALGPSVEPYIIETYGRKPDVFLSNGVDCDFFSPKRPIKFKRGGPYIIGHSTDYTIFKGTEDFLAIMAALKKVGVPVVARISESIPDANIKKKYLLYIRQSGIQNVVTFIGNVVEDKLPDYYRSLDVFVYTGSPECAGGSTASLSVLEAQSCGVPVARSRGDDHEIVDEKTGYYINPHDHAATAKLLVAHMRLAQNKQEKMKKSARDYIRRRFDWDIPSGVLIRTINQLATI